ncbi:MAG: glycosyltransferase family 4 protein [Pseudomonadota bacterium]
MKIVMVHPHDLYHDLEPWTVRITYLAQELVRAGHEVKVVYHEYRSPDGKRAEVTDRSFPFETIPFQRHPFHVFRNAGKLEKIAWWADIVHFQKCTNYAALPAVAAAFYQSRPLHYDWDDWEQAIYEQDNNNPIASWIYFQQMEKHLLKLADTVSVASSGLRELCEKLRFPKERTFFIPVGADLKVFQPSVSGEEVRQKYGWRKKLVIYQGQISGANYVHLFIRAAKIILGKRQDVDFVIVGGGDKLANAQELAGSLGITAGLFFTDKVPHEMVPQFIAAADVAVACFEDNKQVRCKSPLKVKEYMASGKAIIASRVGDLPEMLGDCGKLVAPDSYLEIAAAIDALLDDDEERSRLGKKARERAEQYYSWRKSAETLVEAYHKALHIHHGVTR